MKFIVLLSVLFIQSGIVNQNINAQQSSFAIEQLKAKLKKYVDEGKVFDRGKIQDFDIDSEFGKYRGSSGFDTYQGKNYTLIINFEEVDGSYKNIRIRDFILDEKDKLCSASASISTCAIYKNLKKDSDGFPKGDNACKGISVVKLKTPATYSNCMTVIPIVKAWTVGANGKFTEVAATGLTWCDECP